MKPKGVKNKLEKIKKQNEFIKTENGLFLKTKREAKGITLIALVITVIVLLILAGVTIASLTGENGILKKANEAKDKTNIANIKEMAQADILGCEAENRGSITGEQLQGILCKYFKGVPDTVEELEEDLKNPEYTLKAKDKYGGDSAEVKLSDIYDGELGDGMLADEPTGPVADTETSYVGYYADVNGDGTEDGIIYADLAVGGEGIWSGNNWSYYKYTAETEELKTYTIGDAVESDKFGTAKKPVISAVPESEGKDRFYVMALEDVDTNYHTWYENASGKLPSGKLTDKETDGRIVGTGDNDFGTGKENTKYWLEKYKTIEEATEDPNDMWNIIQSDANKAKYPLETWFVPSKSEWSAFGDMLFKSEEGGFGATTSTYSKFGLKDYYWLSSQYSADFAYYACFSDGYIGGDSVFCESHVRLSATF